MEQRILATLKKASQPLTSMEIAEQADIQTTTMARQYLRQLVARDVIRVIEVLGKPASYELIDKSRTSLPAAVTEPNGKAAAAKAKSLPKPEALMALAKQEQNQPRLQSTLQYMPIVHELRGKRWSWDQIYIWFKQNGMDRGSTALGNHYRKWRAAQQ